MQPRLRGVNMAQALDFYLVQTLTLGTGHTSSYTNAPNGGQYLSSAETMLCLRSKFLKPILMVESAENGSASNHVAKWIRRR